MKNAASRQKKTAAVIGAGPAGLVTAKTFLEFGFEVALFEKGSCLGGTWNYDNDNGRNYLYENLRINTSKNLTRFSDFPFADEVPRIPSHRDMAAYLNAYGDRFGLRDRTRFRSDVTRISPTARGPKRCAAQCDGREELFDIVAVCTGPFSRPHHARDLQADFGGDYLHASAYREPAPFTNRRICVVGAGNSGADIAGDLCHAAARTVIVARSGVFVVPHFLFGRSTGDFTAKYLQHAWLPSAVRRRVMRFLVRMVHGNMTAHGFKPLSHRVHPTISSTLIQNILFQKIHVKQGIDRIDGRSIRFSDGTSEDFDAVIAATGFETDFPFLSPEIVEPSDNRLDLFKRIVAPGWPGLYFIGMINIDVPINRACERQARWAAEVEAGNALLPSRADMQADIAAKRRWTERHYGHQRRHSVQEESVRYYRELARELSRGLTRARRQAVAPIPALAESKG